MKHVLKRIVVTLLTWEAKSILQKYKPEVIAVTGSVGKTAAKDAIYTALSGTARVRKSEKSLNSEIGVPLTIIGEQSAWGNPFGWVRILLKGLGLIFGDFAYTQVLVAEVGADHPGDIQRIAPWLMPDTVVITGVPDMPAHSAFFGSVDDVLKEKASLIAYMNPQGTLILNADDARALSLKGQARGQVITYGITQGDVRALNVETVSDHTRPLGMRFDVTFGAETARCEFFDYVGNAHVYAVLAGIAASLSTNQGLSQIAGKFKDPAFAPGRMHVIRGVNGSTIIDDSYNSSPAAALLALDTLAQIPAGRRIAVLGDMRELGKHSKSAHEAVGKRAAGIVDVLITVGSETSMLVEAAKQAGLHPEKIISFGYNEALQAGDRLVKQLQVGDVVLVKGSQNMIRLERCVERIMAEPKRAKELLVRQEPEWKTLP